VQVVVTVGDPASAFASRYGGSVWPAARIVHAAVDGEQLRVASARGDPVIPRVLDYRRTLEHAMALFPAAREVWLIAGATDNDRQWMNRAVADLAPLGNRIRIKQVLGLRWDDLRNQLTPCRPTPSPSPSSSLPTPTAGRSLTLTRSASWPGRPTARSSSWAAGCSEAARLVATSSIPRCSDGFTGRTVLAILNDPGAAGIPAAEGGRDELDVRRDAAAAVEYLRVEAAGRQSRPEPGGARVAPISVDVPGHGRARHRTGRESSVRCSCSGRNRRRIEVALRNSEEKARASYDEVRDLAGRLISARESERTRIARDLHDDIGQRVASLSIALSRIQRQIPDARIQQAGRCRISSSRARNSPADLRHLSHELHPGALEHLGLLEALRERCDDFGQE
jgi:signal transduction histidine kinase